MITFAQVRIRKELAIDSTSELAGSMAVANPCIVHKQFPTTNVAGRLATAIASLLAADALASLLAAQLAPALASWYTPHYFADKVALV